METVLLRFRDFGADSIQEHKKLIAEIGFVWWGWWKKSEEPDRSRELEKLRARLQTGVVEVGLFDRSEERYFIATVSECAHRGNSERISSPSPTAAPPYYRNEKLPAWFKLTHIEAIGNADVRFKDPFRSLPVGNETFYDVGEPGLINAAESQQDRTTIPVRGHQVLHLSNIHFGESAFPGVASPGNYPLDQIIVNDLQKLASCQGRNRRRLRRLHDAGGWESTLQ